MKYCIIQYFVPLPSSHTPYETAFEQKQLTVECFTSELRFKESYLALSHLVILCFTSHQRPLRHSQRAKKKETGLINKPMPYHLIGQLPSDICYK